MPVTSFAINVSVVEFPLGDKTVMLEQACKCKIFILPVPVRYLVVHPKSGDMTSYVRYEL